MSGRHDDAIGNQRAGGRAEVGGVGGDGHNSQVCCVEFLAESRRRDRACERDEDPNKDRAWSNFHFFKPAAQLRTTVTGASFGRSLAVTIKNRDPSAVTSYWRSPESPVPLGTAIFV